LRIPFLDSYIEKKLSQQPREVRAIISDSISPWTGNRPLQPPADYRSLIKEYRGEIYSLAKRNAQAVAQTPLRLYTNKPKSRQAKYTKSILIKTLKYEELQSKAHLIKWTNKSTEISEVLEHPFLDMLYNINDFLNGFEAIELLDLFLELTGNAYWYIIKNPATGIPCQIWPLYSQWVKIKVDANRFISHYLYGVGSDTQKSRYEPEDIVHFKMPNPMNLWYGMGPLQASLLQAGLNVSYDEFNKYMLDNNLVMPFYLQTDTILTEQQIRLMRSGLEREHKGINRTGRFGIFHSGMKPVPITTNPKDFEFVAGSELTLKKLARAFDVPWSVLSTDNVNLANAKAGYRQWMQSGILPRLKRIEQKINERIMPMFDETLFVAFDNPVPEDNEFNLKRHEMYVKNKIMTVNEIRESEGLEPVEWGDEPVEPAMPAFGKSGPELKTKAINNNKPEQLKKIKKWLDSTSVRISETVTDINLASGAVVEQIDWHIIREEGEKALNEVIDDNLLVGMKKGNHLLGKLATAFDIQDPAVIRWAKEYVGERITMINEETRQAIRNSIAERLRQGTTPRELAREIRSVNSLGLNARQQKALSNYAARLKAGGKLSDTSVNMAVREYRDRLLTQRAEMIARTESASALIHGELESYNKSQVDMVEWNAANDACDICLPHNGERMPIGQSRGILPYHPHCRCDWLPVID